MAIVALLGLVACDGGSKAPSAPSVAAPAVPRAAAFRVVYRIDDTAGPAPQVATDNRKPLSKFAAPMGSD